MWLGSPRSGTGFQHWPKQMLPLTGLFFISWLTFLLHELYSQAGFLYLVEKVNPRGGLTSSYLRRWKALLLLGFILIAKTGLSLTPTVEIMPSSEPITGVLWCARWGLMLFLGREDGAKWLVTHWIGERQFWKRGLGGGHSRYPGRFIAY